MPFRDYTQFDSATLDKMAKAYDAVVSRLNIKSDDPRTSRLAAKIATLAAAGERDVTRLAERAIVGLK
jgi:hypothetical protein